MTTIQERSRVWRTRFIHSAGTMPGHHEPLGSPHRQPAEISRLKTGLLTIPSLRREYFRSSQIRRGYRVDALRSDTYPLIPEHHSLLMALLPGNLAVPALLAATPAQGGSVPNCPAGWRRCFFSHDARPGEPMGPMKARPHASLITVLPGTAPFQSGVARGSTRRRSAAQRCLA